jgi:hypothetical protein
MLYSGKGKGFILVELEKIASLKGLAASIKVLQISRCQ